MIRALRKDGTPVREGDRVLAVWDNGLKSFGRIKAAAGAMRFSSKRGAKLQTYVIRCDDGKDRPAHAWHIKMALPESGRAKFQNRKGGK